MKNYSKVGKSTGKAAYRTPSTFQAKAHSKDAKRAQSQRPVRSQNLAKRMNHPRPES
ncbi:MAG TPA: hypothetical protein VGA53_01875 [Candidatus Paceibacterota bacterium]